MYRLKRDLPLLRAWYVRWMRTCSDVMNKQYRDVAATCPMGIDYVNLMKARGGKKINKKVSRQMKFAAYHNIDWVRAMIHMANEKAFDEGRRARDEDKLQSLVGVFDVATLRAAGCELLSRNGL